MSTQTTSIENDAGTLPAMTQVHFKDQPCACLTAFLTMLHLLQIEAIWWLAKNGRVKLSERTTSIILPRVAYPVIFQGLKDSCQVTLSGTSQCQGITYTDHAISVLCQTLFWLNVQGQNTQDTDQKPQTLPLSRRPLAPRMQFV